MASRNEFSASSVQPTFTTLPVEVRSRVMDYLLNTTELYQQTPRVVDDLSNEQFEANLVKDEGQNYLNVPPLRTENGIAGHNQAVHVSQCNLHPAIMRVNAASRDQGHAILYGRNRFLAVETSAENFKYTIQQFGILGVWGPFELGSRKAVTSKILPNYQTPTKIHPVMTWKLGPRRGRQIYLFCMQDVLEVRRYIWLHCYQDQPNRQARWEPFSIHLRSNLAMPGVCTEQNALEKLFTQPATPWLVEKPYAYECGTFHNAQGYDVEREIQLEESQSRDYLLNRTSFQRALLYLESLLDSGLQALLHGYTSRAVELFQSVRTQAADIIRMKKHTMLPTAPLDDNSKLMKLYITSSYLLCHLHARIDVNGKGERRKAARRCVEYGLAIIGVVSRCQVRDWEARIALQLCRSFAELGMWQRARDNARTALEALAIAGSEDDGWEEEALDRLTQEEADVSSKMTYKASLEGTASGVNEGLRLVWLTFVEGHEVVARARWGDWQNVR